MKDFELKSIISKLTGIKLTKIAMPQFVGQSNYIHRIDWLKFDPKNVPAEFPKTAKTWFRNKVQEFENIYKKNLSEEQSLNFSSMFFCWYAIDNAIDNNTQNKLEQLPDDETKQELLRVANFIKDRNIPLLCSPEEIKVRGGNEDSVNGGSSHLETYGKFWGARYVNDENGNSKVKTFRWGIVPVGDSQKTLNSAYFSTFTNIPANHTHDSEDPWVHLVYPVIAQSGDTVGLFGKEINGNQYFSLMNPDVAKQFDMNPNVNATLAKLLLNQLEKFFNFDGKFLTPGSTQMKLSAVNQDGSPAPDATVVGRATSGKGRPSITITQDPSVFRIYVNGDGKLYWLKNNKFYPMTESQAKQIIKISPNYKYLVGKYPEYEIGFQSNANKQAYLRDVALLNQLRNLIISPSFNTADISLIPQEQKSSIKHLISQNANNVQLWSQIKRKFKLNSSKIMEILVEDIPLEKRQQIFEALKMGNTNKNIAVAQNVTVEQVEYLKDMYFNYPVSSGKLQILLVAPSGSTGSQTGPSQTTQRFLTQNIQEGFEGKTLKNTQVRRQITVLHTDYDLQSGKTSIMDRAKGGESKTTAEKEEFTSYEIAFNWAVEKYGLNDLPPTEQIQAAQMAFEKKNQEFLNRLPNTPNLIQEGVPQEPVEPQLTEPVVENQNTEVQPQEEIFGLDDLVNNDEKQANYHGIIKTSKDIINKFKKYN